MEFRLIYDGKLPAAGRSDTRSHDKDRIRRIFSKQLQELYRTHPSLQSYFDRDMDYESVRNDPEAYPPTVELLKDGISRSGVEVLSHRYRRCGKGFVPLIRDPLGIACALDILFLRRDYPGNLIVSGGDLDNRIKVLFDALRLPQNCDEVLPPVDGQADEDPIFVLLEDDKQIVDVKVTTDRLLVPKLNDEHINDVRLIIHVRSVIVDPTRWGALLF